MINRNSVYLQRVSTKVLLVHPSNYKFKPYKSETILKCYFLAYQDHLNIILIQDSIKQYTTFTGEKCFWTISIIGDWY